MNISLAAVDAILARTLDVLNNGDRSLLGALDELPAPIYVTDADGVITYYNPACIAFAGRVPALGQDRWCVIGSYSPKMAHSFLTTSVRWPTRS